MDSEDIKIAHHVLDYLVKQTEFEISEEEKDLLKKASAIVKECV